MQIDRQTVLLEPGQQISVIGIKISFLFPAAFWELHVNHTVS